MPASFASQEKDDEQAYTEADLRFQQHTRKQNTLIRELQDKLKKFEGDTEGVAEATPATDTNVKVRYRFFPSR